MYFNYGTAKVAAAIGAAAGLATGVGYGTDEDENACCVYVAYETRDGEGAVVPCTTVEYFGAVLATQLQAHTQEV